MPPQPTESPVAVVTGSSSGIGRAAALEFARQGWRVVLHATRSVEATEATAKSIRAAGQAAAVVQFDLQQTEQLSGLIEQAFAHFGQVDAWINNAGADVLTGPGANRPWLEKAEALWRTDLLGTLALSRQVGARLQTQRRARPSGDQPGRYSIVNIGWDQAWQGMAGESGELFAAIKGGVMAATLSLAQSLAPDVRVNCVAPGWIQTAWGRQASVAWQQRAQRESLMERWGQPEDVAQLITYLCSPAASFISGQVINVNGGFRFAAPAHPALQPPGAGP